jgi:uncharacterized membrane protein YhhN
MKTKILSALYFTTGIAYMIIAARNPEAAIFLKALVIPLLIALFVMNVRQLFEKTNLLMLAGLMFSWAGDVLLEIPGSKPMFFIAGLFCFLLTHIMYFTSFITTPGRNFITPGKSPYLLVLAAYGSLLLICMFNDLGTMKIPVVLYTVVILCMVAGALNRYYKVSRKGFYMVLTGAVLFLLSDSAIAINKYSHPFNHSGLVIMSTYILAQYLIIKGFLSELTNESLQGRDQPVSTDRSKPSSKRSL